jgi:D-lactate dehydrogenase
VLAATPPADRSPAFTTDPAEIERLWNVRKGTFPAVGAVRKPGTTVIIEDVSFSPTAGRRLPRPAAAVRQARLPRGDHLRPRAGGQRALRVHQDFGIESEVARYAAFMDELCRCWWKNTTPR